MTSASLDLLNTTDALTLISQCRTATDEQSITSLLHSLCQVMGFDYIPVSVYFTQLDTAS
ncbi:MAG: hypothetical protein ACRCVV_20230 [Shewanella sp.]